MMSARVIPCLLLKNGGLVKTKNFKDPVYLGDPINTLKIFNEKEVDEVVILDISATGENRKPNFNLIQDIASECFMPVCYGGGIRTLEDIKQLFKIGVEKVSINTIAVEDPSFIKQAADYFGSQSIIISIDVKRNFWGQNVVYTNGGKKNTKCDPVAFAKKVAEMGAGEIFFNSIDHDGTMSGYDLELIKRVTEAVNIPVIACGGAGKLEDFRDAVNIAGATAVAAGSFFIFQKKTRAFLISYPDIKELNNLFDKGEI